MKLADVHVFMFVSPILIIGAFRNVLQCNVSMQQEFYRELAMSFD